MVCYFTSFFSLRSVGLFSVELLLLVFILLSPETLFVAGVLFIAGVVLLLLLFEMLLLVLLELLELVFDAGAVFISFITSFSATTVDRKTSAAATSVPCSL